MPPTNMAQRELARQLRIEQRLSIREIHLELGVAKGTLSGWLRDIPLTGDEVKAKQRAARAKHTPVPKKDRGSESGYHQRVPVSKLTKLQKGKLAEIAALFRMTQHGMTVFGSHFDGDCADWVVETDQGFQKVQVKWAQRQRQGLPLVPLQRKKGHAGFQPYRKGDFDFLVAYDYFTDTCYVWSWDEVKTNNKSITICPEAAEAWSKMSR
jgi:transcriptional regulator with XRE-family HTH domain